MNEGWQHNVRSPERTRTYPYIDISSYISLYRPLTLYAELDRVADVLSLAVGHSADVMSRPVPAQTLQHQGHVAHDDAVTGILLQDVTLK